MMSMMLGGDSYGVGAGIVPINACHSPVAMAKDIHYQSSPEHSPQDSYKGPISPALSDPPNSQLGSTSTRGTPKACGVCGDVAKSMHFGGLSCDSCKAFFRRSVQNNAYKGFSCPYDKQCIIAVSSRKACQFCRFKKCLAIGMEKGWVMPEDERKRMMQKRQERKTKPTPEVSNNNSMYALNEDDRAEISLIVSLYQKAYAEIPYDDGNSENLSDISSKVNPGSASVLGPWLTFCRRIAYFFSLFKDFAELCCDDQFLLLKTAITSAGIIMGSVVYDGSTCKLSPRAMRPAGGHMPNVSMKNVENLVPPDLFCRVVKFFRKFRHICIDEKMAIILILISLYSPELMGLRAKDTVQVLQERYIHILDRYTKYVFREKSLIMFPKAIVSLADIRELADRTYQMNLKGRSPMVSTELLDTRINHGAVNADGANTSMPDLKNPLSTQAAVKRARLAATGDQRDVIYQRIWQKVVDQMHISSMKLRAPSLLPFIIHIIKKLMREEGIPDRSASTSKRCSSSNQKIKRIGNKVRVLEVDPNERMIENLEIKEEVFDPEVYDALQQHSHIYNSNPATNEYWAQENYSNSCSNDSMSYSAPSYSSPDFMQHMQVSDPQICGPTFYPGVTPTSDDCDTVATFNGSVSTSAFSPMATTQSPKPSPEMTQMSPLSPFSPPISSVQSQQSYLEGSSDMVYSPYSSTSSSSSPEDANLNFSSGLTDIEVNVLTELLECVTNIQSQNVKEMFDDVNVKEILPLRLLTELKRKLCNGHDS